MNLALRQPDLTFDEATHVYRWRGAVVPSVTQILAPLTDWSMIDPETLERARMRGTAVHKLIELYLAGDLDMSSVRGVLLGYFEQWLEFVAHTGFYAHGSEIRLYSERYGYAGTLDLDGEFPDEPESLIDIKAGAVIHVARPQTAAYAQLLVENGIRRRPVRRCLDIKETSWKLTKPYRDPNDLRVFLSQLTIHNYRRENGLG